MAGWGDGKAGGEGAVRLPRVVGAFGGWRVGLACVLVGCTAAFVWMSRDWPLVGDASLIHYICFLMAHGLAPYRDLGDMNLPGAFLVEWGAMHAFGAWDVGWRVFDFFLLAMGGGAMAAIARPYDWLAGVFAGCLFALAHGRDGMAQGGQRDLTLAVCLLAGTAVLFGSVRGRRVWLAGAAGLLFGVAASIKPTALPLAVALMAMAAWTLQRREVRAGRYVGAAAGMFCLGPAASLVFLVREGAVAAFVHGLRTVVPFYASLGHRPLGYLAVHSVSPVMALVVIWAAVLVVDRADFGWERAGLLVGAGFGFASYVVQARGLPYYRYPLLAFLLPLMGIDFCVAMRRAGWGRVLGGMGLAVGALGIAPISVWGIHKIEPRNTEFITSLEGNLERLGGAGLAGDVQCIDSISGCGTVLYRMRLVQRTGVLSDFLLFGRWDAPGGSAQPPVVEETRATLMRAMERKPPRVVVVSSWLHIGGPGEYRKMERWPWLGEELSTKYRLETEWKPTRAERWWSREQWPAGYRIYVLKEGVR